MTKLSAKTFICGTARPRTEKTSEMMKDTAIIGRRQLQGDDKFWLVRATMSVSRTPGKMRAAHRQVSVGLLKARQHPMVHVQAQPEHGREIIKNQSRRDRSGRRSSD